MDPVIDVPADDEETFKRLYDFMDNGDYKPSVKERQDTVSGTRRASWTLKLTAKHFSRLTSRCTG